MAEDVFKIAEAYVELTTRDQKLDAGIGRMEKQVTKFEQVATKKLGFVKKLMAGGLGAQGANTALMSLMNPIAALQAGVAGLAAYGITKFVTSSVAAAGEAERSMNAVKAALASTGQEVEGNATSIDNLANSLRENVNLSDEAARQAAAYAISMGSTADQAKVLLNTAAGLADMFGGDLTDATKSLQKASQGNWMELQRTIPALKNLNTNAEKMALLQKMSAQGMQRQKALMGDYEGSVKQLMLAFGELQESLGGLVTGPATAGIQALSDLIKLLTPGSMQNETLFSSVVQDIWELEAKAFDAAEAIASMLQQDDVAKGFAEQAENARKGIDGLKQAENQRLNDRIKGEQNIQGKINTTADKVKKAKKELAGTIHNSMEDYWKEAQKAMFKAGEEATKTGAKVADAQDEADEDDEEGGVTSAAPAAAAAQAAAAAGKQGQGQGKGSRELHDREWHRKRYEQLKNKLGSAFDPDNAYITEKNQGMGKRVQQWQKEAQESFDISKHGTKAAADLSRMDMKDYKGTRSKIDRVKKEANAPFDFMRKDLDARLPDTAENKTARDSVIQEIERQRAEKTKWLASYEKDEMKTMEERQSRRHKAFEPKIAAEKESLNTEIDKDATDVRGALQDMFGQPQSGKPIKVESPESAKLLSVLNHLDSVLPRIANQSTFGSN
jgi:hypothetical protein